MSKWKPPPLSSEELKDYFEDDEESFERFAPKPPKSKEITKQIKPTKSTDKRKFLEEKDN